jgi:KDO2-lipid IV(A) lauroyltransferase
LIYKFLCPSAALYAFLFKKNVRNAVVGNMKVVWRYKGLRNPLLWVVSRVSGFLVLLHSAYFWADEIQTGRISLQRFHDSNVRSHGVDYLLKAVESGRGAIIYGGHGSGPVLASHSLIPIGVRPLFLTESLPTPELDREVHKLRATHGLEFMHVGARGLGTAFKKLRVGGVVAILIDRGIKDNGIPLEYFGKKAKFPLGAAELALRTDSLLVPASCRRIGWENFVCSYLPPIDPRSFMGEDAAENLLAAMLRHLEDFFRYIPSQMVITEPKWPEGE